MAPEKGKLLEVVAAAFPSGLRPDVERVVSIVGADGTYGTSPGSVLINGERVTILHRRSVAEPWPEATAGMSTRQRLIPAAINSRHGDGLIRERNLEHLFVDEP